MRKFLIVSHGEFAGGIRSALELITGPNPDVVVLQAYVDENKSVQEEITAVLRSADAEWVVFTDLLGGSVTNQVIRAAADLAAAGGGAGVEGVASGRVHIVAGVNLPLVIEVVMGDAEMPVAEILAEAIGRAREQLVYVNDIINNNA